MSEKRTVANVNDILDKHKVAETISNMWSTADSNRQPWLAQKLEIRNYVFATDTNTTTNSTLPWKNKTTLPKLCQIRDNLHANYMEALFPSDDWMKWEPGTQDDATVEKATAVQQYLSNKCRLSGFAETVSQLLLDYIDVGNAFYDVVFVNETHTDDETGEVIQGYRGPKLVRVSYRDIVFDPQASSFDSTWKITRYMRTFGELMAEVENEPESGFKAEVLERARNLRNGSYGIQGEDYNLIAAYNNDGFSTFQQYVQSGLVELLEFEGSLFDMETGKLEKNQIITVIDRTWVVRQERMPSWLGKSTKGHAGWRQRPDNLYAMGPLDNLIGMQYRIDHLENAKADAIDLAIQPPLVISGSVEEFEYGPNAEIYLGEGGAITELGKNLQGVIGADNMIGQYELKMEEMAGAPKQAMGIRTPGEKTKFEVQTLDQAASRIFQHKLRNFEKFVLEPALNLMLEVGRRNMTGADLIRVMDDDLGVATFLNITREDITASGKLRAIGARHFAAQATLVQNLMGIMQSGFGQDQGIRAHWSGKKLAKLLEEVLGLSKYDLYQENVQIMETTETQQLLNQGAEDVQNANMVDPEGAIPEEGL